MLHNAFNKYPKTQHNDNKSFIHSILTAHIPVIASMDTRAFSAKRIGTNAGHRRVKMEAFASMAWLNTIAVVQMDSRVTHKTRMHNSIK